MPSPTCGTQLAHLLEAYGVSTIFGIPGVHNVELYRGLHETRIRHVSPRHEQGAGFMADGYARTSGKPGVCFLITGPGVTNAATAMGQAYGDSVPLLVMSSVNRRHELGFGRGFLHEMPSQRALTAGLTAFSHTLLRPDELPDVIAAAFSVFTSARPRPVHIEIPIDVLETRLDRNPTAPKVVATSAPAADPAGLDDAAKLLRGAKRVAILAGGGAANAAEPIRQLAEALAAPTMLTTSGRGILPPDHPLLAGFAVAYDEGRAILEEADAVLAIGTELGETDYEFWATKPIAFGAALVRIDIDPRQMAIGPPARLAITSDAALATRGLVQRLAKSAGRRDRTWADSVVRRAAKIMTRTREPEDPFYDQLLDIVRATLRDPIVVGDSTKPAYRAMLTYRAQAPRSFWTAATGFGTLGYALPAAIGAKIAAPGRPVVAIMGDGGIQFTLPELMSAKEAGAGVIVLVWNNTGYREIKDYMVSKEIAPLAVDIGPPHFLKSAAAVGIEGTRVGSLDELGKTLTRLRATRAPVLVEMGPWMVTQ